LQEREARPRGREEKSKDSDFKDKRETSPIIASIFSASIFLVGTAVAATAVTASKVHRKVASKWGNFATGGF
jgi:hypothetical protein